MPIQVGRGEWNTMWCDPNAAESDARSRFKDSELSKSESRILTLIIRSLCERDFAPCELIEVIASKKESEEAARILLWRLVEKKIVELIVGSDNKRWLSLSRDLFGIRHQSDVKKRTDRFYNQPAKKQDERKDFERDRDRILFSSAFRRLAGVTQVVAPTESQPIHNRLTHSLKVAQIGRGLAVTLLENTSKDLIRTAGDLDPFVVEAAGLAHDLGHPPFGHIAESELNRLVGEAEASILLNCKEENGISSEDLEDLRKQLGDGFEGNAQSFRIVTTLSSRFHDLKGLDLTRATLCAVLKYPWVRNDSQAQPLSSEKWGAYTSEAKYLRWARELSPSDGQVRSLEAALMDWADDIAYAVHDLEDFYRAGLIPLDRLASSAHERTVFLQHENERQQKKRILPGSTRDDLAESFQRLMCVAPFKGPFAGTHRERAVLRAFTSTLISNYIHAVSLDSSGWGEHALKIPDWARVEVETLKGLTWHYVIHSQSLSSQRFGQRNVIRSLFEIYLDAALSEEWTMFPAYFRGELGNGLPKLKYPRMVADVIASMSEVQAIETFQRLTGQSFGSALIRPSI